MIIININNLFNSSDAMHNNIHSDNADVDGDDDEEEVAMKMNLKRN